MAIKIQKRRDTAANWAAVNPVLAQGEEGLELDTGKEKIGNGTANWNSLPYNTLGITASSIGAATAAQGAKADTAVQPAGLTKGAIGLGNVDNTSDLNKPISTATAVALAAKADTTSVAPLSNATPQALGTATAGTATEASRADHRHAMPNATQVGADAIGSATAAVAAHAAAADPHPGYTLETDSRLSDSRTPTAHKSTHVTGGTDALSPADIGAATAAQGAKADTAIQPGNAALSDAREWSAETISQAEAEAGLATTRRAFTAQRVFQAVAAWWAGSASKTKLDGIANGATANSTDAQLRDRSTHTGTQTAATISDFAASASAAALVQSVAGRTGTVTLAKGDVGLSNVDNTRDADKPISTATATALGGKAGTGAIGSSGLTMATARLLGRTTAGAGAVEEIQVSGGTFANGVLTLSGLPSTLTADASGNLTFSGRWIQSTNGAASAPPMALTGTWFSGGTSTTTRPQLLIEPAGTTSTSWNTAGTGLGVNAPSGFGGDLAWFGVNGARQVAILSNGVLRWSTSGQPSLVPIVNGLVFQNATFGASDIAFVSPTLTLTNNYELAWNNTGDASFNAGRDLRLFRDAAGILAQRNGTAAQTSRIYNTFTDSSNYERLAHTWLSNVCYTRPENAGTGSARLYVPVTGGTTVANLPAAATAGTGARSFVTDANATTFLSTVAGGGSNRVPVVSDGTNWLIA